MRSGRGLALLLPILAVFWAAPVMAAPAKDNWVAAWATSQQRVVADTTLSNATVRMIARVTLPGTALRLQFQNITAAPVIFGKVTAAPRALGPRLVAGLVKPVSFGGAASVTIAAGASVESDPVPLAVEAGEDIAVSVYLPGEGVQPNAHVQAHVTNYLSESGAGDQTENQDGKSFGKTFTATYWLSAIDVLAGAPARAIVAFGDSLTDGTCTADDGHERWEDVLAQRLMLAMPGKFSLVNEGVGGDTILGRGEATPPPNGWHGIDRLERDVLSQAGAAYMIVFAGTNDVSAKDAKADAIIAGLKTAIAAATQRGIKVIGVTLVPRQAAVFGQKGDWTDEKSALRNTVNRWIRKSEGMVAVFDFDAVVRDASDPERLAPAYNCGDDIHPTALGYDRMGAAVDLKAFR